MKWISSVFFESSAMSSSILAWVNWILAFTDSMDLDFVS